MMRTWNVVVLLLLPAPLSLASCVRHSRGLHETVSASSASAAVSSAVVPPDALGPRPPTPMPAAFLPPSPAVFRSVGGISVWLLTRAEVPIVSCDMTVPTGASSDPAGKGGLAYATANMLQEGAGTRGALDLARALDDLGARVGTDANADASFVSVTVLKRNLGTAFALFADIVARPRFEPAEFKRTKDLWANALRQREKDPDATARVVYRAALFGTDHPYGHPWDGTPESAAAVSLDDVKRFYVTAWRPDQATLVCVGAIAREELSPIVDAAFASWKPPPTPAAPPMAPAAPKGPWPRLVLVDRADAPQAVIATVKPGVTASSAEAPPLWRVNDAIGGSFTSRLNQDLREARGYTYGARSRFSLSRGAGQVVTWANVVTDKTGDALTAMLDDLSKFAAGGLTDDEVQRTRSQARGELVSVYESVESIAGHLAADASLGLPPDYEAEASHARDAAEKEQLDPLAARFFDPRDAIVVVVGPRARVQPMLDKVGMPPPQLRDAQGRVITDPLRAPAIPAKPSSEGHPK
ncbi:MAG: insulinase family protein [Myxococcota bacterium]|nr:insulinase family protein [Myxococcota bacterium]